MTLSPVPCEYLSGVIPAFRLTAGSYLYSLHPEVFGWDCRATTILQQFAFSPGTTGILAGCFQKTGRNWVFFKRCK